MITLFSFFKLSMLEGQLGWVRTPPHHPPVQLQLLSISPSPLTISPPCLFPHPTVAQWTAPTAISHHYHLPSWASASHYHAALLIFLSYQLANHKPLCLMAQFGVCGYSFCRSTSLASLSNCPAEHQLSHCCPVLLLTVINLVYS